MNDEMINSIRTIKIVERKVSSTEYIEFLTRTDLGKQYPKERFNERIKTLLKNTQISLVAENEENKIVGVCLGLTDFAYWLLITDLGIDREYIKKGIGSEFLKLARIRAGGKANITMLTHSNKDAVSFYEKNGLKQSEYMMEIDDIEWSEFEVGEEQLKDAR